MQGLTADLAPPEPEGERLPVTCWLPALRFLSLLASWCLVVLWMDEIHFAPPKKPWNDDSPVNTNKQWFPSFPSAALIDPSLFSLGWQALGYLLRRYMDIGVLFGGFAYKIEGPGLDGVCSIYQGHLFFQKATYVHGLTVFFVNGYAQRNESCATGESSVSALSRRVGEPWMQLSRPSGGLENPGS